MTGMRAGVIAGLMFLTACSGVRPVLYPNPHLQSVGKDVAEQDINACKQLAESSGAEEGRSNFTDVRNPDRVTNTIHQQMDAVARQDQNARRPGVVAEIPDVCGAGDDQGVQVQGVETLTDARLPRSQLAGRRQPHQAREPSVRGLSAATRRLWRSRGYWDIPRSCCRSSLTVPDRQSDHVGACLCVAVRGRRIAAGDRRRSVAEIPRKLDDRRTVRRRHVPTAEPDDIPHAR